MTIIVDFMFNKLTVLLARYRRNTFLQLLQLSRDFIIPKKKLGGNKTGKMSSLIELSFFVLIFGVLRYIELILKTIGNRKGDCA